MDKPDSRLKCTYAKQNKYGDVVCKLDRENCDYGKGICKNYKESTVDEGKKE